MKIEIREKFPNFVGFVSGVDLKKELNHELVKKIECSNLKVQGKKSGPGPSSQREQSVTKG